jgi:hypothetical protein
LSVAVAVKAGSALIYPTRALYAGKARTTPFANAGDRTGWLRVGIAEATSFLPDSNVRTLAVSQSEILKEMK